MVDDDGAADPGNCDGAGTVSATIQGAVTAVAAGTKIDVCPGTYTEQVSVTGAAKNNVELRSVTPQQAVIKAPATMADPGDIVRVNGASDVAIRDFAISGPLPNALFCSTFVRSGIRVDGGGSATIDGNQISEIRAADANLRGCQNGIAIMVGRNSESTSGTATITNNVIGAFQKGGILVDGADSSADVGLNQVTGEGPVNYIAQNGVQISRGATGHVAGNTVQDHTYSLAPTSSSSGILVFQPGAGLVINNNDVRENDDNIPLFTASGVVVQQNAVRNSTFYDGLFADGDTSGNQFAQNVASNNDLFDCEDLSIGGGTSGTANSWSGNIGTTAVPPGICTPPFGGPTQQGPQAQARAAGHNVVPAT